MTINHTRKPAITKKVHIIPGFSKYKMDSLGRIYDVHDRTVPITKHGSIDDVFLVDDAGDGRLMLIDHLFEVSFPEYH